MAEMEQKKQWTFRKFTYGSVDLDQLLDMSYEKLMQLYRVRQQQQLNPEPQQAEEAALATEAAVQGQERCAAQGEARGGEDAPARHDHSARDGGQHGGRLQWQDLQPGGNQA